MSKIPKYIHYCWFGGNPISPEVERYINTWKKYMPEYEIIEWNENNFDVMSMRFTREAYEAKKYAFVSDVARIYALNKMGGIYLDVDVEVIKPFDNLFENFSAVLGSETETAIGTGFLAFTPGHKICKDLLKYYESEGFLDKPKMFTNTKLFAEYIEDNYKISPPKEVTRFGDDLIIYPQDYFTAYNIIFGINEVTENTVCIHHYVGSWLNPKKRSIQQIKYWIKRRLKIFWR